MSTATRAMDGEAAVTSTELSRTFIHWEVDLFITRFLTGLVPILHYMAGAQAGDVGLAL